MFETLLPQADEAEKCALLNDLSAPPRPGRPGYRGPERRRPGGSEAWLALMLDEIDYGMLVVGADGHLLYANHTARAALDDEHPLQLLGTEVRARHSADVVALREALRAAVERRLRRLLTLGETHQPLNVAVVPLGQDSGADAAVLLVFGKRRVCQELSTLWFARIHGLTPAETQVLQGLCNGEVPGDVARRNQVALSTVRSQISSIRGKTGAPNIRDLVQKVAALPPLVSALRS